MDYRVLALKYRPGRFEEIVGQEAVTSVLAGAIEQNRVAQAYLFSGPRGCGKTSSARILAKSLNCEQGPTPTPCGECESCRSIAAGSSLAVIEIDAASTGGVDDIRGIREEAALGSIGGRHKVYILDEAHQITAAGANALLKTLEEPPPNTVFVLATTEPQKIIPTIHSRCQRFQFRLLSVDEIAGRLGVICGHEGIDAPEEVLRAIARRADGSMRDGITLLDQVLASAGAALDLDTVTGLLGLTRHDHYFALSDAWQERDGAAALRALNEVLGGGLGPREFALGLAQFFRDLMMLRLDPELLAGELGEEDRRRCGELAAHWQVEDLLHLTRLAGERGDQIRFASQPRVLLETLVVEIARFESRILLTELLARLGKPPGRSAGGDGGTKESRPARRPESERPPRSEAASIPAPDPAPPAADAASPRASTVAAAQAAAAPDEVWGEFVRRIGSSMKSLGSFLEHARPGPHTEKHFSIVVENPFHLAMLDTPEHMRLMGDTLGGLTGAARQIRLELVGTGGGASRASATAGKAPGGEAKAETKTARISRERADRAQRDQALKDHDGSPLIRDLLERFDGEIIED